ncbi:O-methyltransferase (plasmid) [Streptomyces sp. BI20]|uniref:O-methyltransferase n=1 Tax=Streptomyces sp. BI20 TaxID=3403460 RepID=UPI003C77A8B9
MRDTPTARPPALDAILADTEALGFAMACEERTGALLAALASSKPGGRLLELGTGTGAGTSWLLHGMTPDARLLTIDEDPGVRSVAETHLGHDRRVRFVTADADTWLDTPDPGPYALAYADCPPGKFTRLDDVLRLLEPGGLYVVDDLLPQPSWPPGHQSAVDAFLTQVTHHPHLHPLRLTWSTGLLIATHTP